MREVYGRKNDVTLILGFVCSWLSMLMVLLIVVQWLLFVEFSLHRSRDVIRRRYPVLLIPFAIAVLFILINFGMNVYSHIHVVRNMFFFDLGILLEIATSVILLFYLFCSFFLVAREKKRRPMPRLVAIAPEAGCVLLGFLLSFLFGYEVFPLSIAFGLVMENVSLRRLFRMEDAKTGFYNKNYMDTIVRYYTEHEEKGGTVIRFRTKKGTKALSEILHTLEPDNSKTVYVGNRTFLLISETQPKSLIQWFISLVLEEAKKNKLEVWSDFVVRTDETAEQFFSGFLEE